LSWCAAIPYKGILGHESEGLRLENTQSWDDYF